MMMPDDVVLVKNVIPAVVTGVVLAAAAATAAAALLVPAVRNRVLPKPKETRLADFLPFASLMPDGKTVVTRDKSVSRVLEVTGIDQAFLREGDIVPLFLARKSMIDSISEYDVSLRFYLKRDHAPVTLPSEFQNSMARTIAARWNTQFTKAFSNRMMISVSLPAGSSSQKLDEIINTIKAALAEYKPVELTSDPKDSVMGDTTIMNFWASMTSPLTQPDPAGSGEGLSEVLCADTVEFLDEGLIKFSNGAEELYASIVGIKRLADGTPSIMTTELASISHRMTVMQAVEPVKKAKALMLLGQNKVMMSTVSFSEATETQYNVAMELVEGMDDSRSSLCYFSEVLTMYGSTIEECLEAEAEAKRILTSWGFVPVRETGAAQASYFMQFPSIKLWPRQYRLFSSNVANMVTFDRAPSGLSRSAWGDGPICTFKTGSGTAYSHQFHVTGDKSGPPVAHGLCIAPTGGGKTTLFTFLSMMAMRHDNVRSFIFDRLKGAYIFTTAMDGRYVGFNDEPATRSIQGGMNPLQCEPTPDNLAFLTNWLKAITGCDDQESANQIARMLDIGFQYLNDDERSLAMLYEACVTPGSRFGVELRRWIAKEQYGPLFNAEADSLGLENSRLVSFDMTNIFTDNRLAQAAISYILHRVRLSMTKNGSPGLIFIDETAPMIADAKFREIYLVMLREFRKINGAVISVFQSPSAIAGEVGQTVRQQAGVYYLFPNPGAKAVDYKDYDLNEREMDFIMGISPINRRVRRGLLIKRPSTRESVVVDVDLKGALGPYLYFFSSDATHVRKASELQAKHPDNQWLKPYIAALLHSE